MNVIDRVNCTFEATFYYAGVEQLFLDIHSIGHVESFYEWKTGYARTGCVKK